MKKKQINQKFDFSRFIKYEKPHEIFYRGQQGTLTVIVQVVRSIRQHLRGCWEHKFLKKRQCFQWKKKLVTSFSHFIECDRPQKTIL